MSTVGVFELVAMTPGSLQADDVLPVVDVHDTTQSPQGSLKKFLLSELYLTDTTPVTVSTPLPNVKQTWNASGTAFTLIKGNAVNTASSVASLLLDLQVDSISQWKVSKAGAVTQTGGLAITGALTGATTGAFSGAVTAGALSAAAGSFSGDVAVATNKFTVAAASGNTTVAGTLAVTGVSTLAKVTAGDGTTPPVLPPVLGAEVNTTNATASSNYVAGCFYMKQSVATTGGPQGCEGIVESTHTSGSVASVVGLAGNVYTSGVGGTTTLALGVTSGALLSTGSVVTAYRAFNAQLSTGAGATVTTAVQYYAAPLSLAVTNWQLYFASSASSGGITFRDTALAMTATTGYLHIPSCAGTPTGVPASIPTGQIPLVYDSSNNFLYVYAGGAWKKSTVYT